MMDQKVEYSKKYKALLESYVALLNVIWFYFNNGKFMVL